MEKKPIWTAGGPQSDGESSSSDDDDDEDDNKDGKNDKIDDEARKDDIFHRYHQATAPTLPRIDDEQKSVASSIPTIPAYTRRDSYCRESVGRRSPPPQPYQEQQPAHQEELWTPEVKLFEAFMQDDMVLNLLHSQVEVDNKTWQKFERKYGVRMRQCEMLLEWMEENVYTGFFFPGTIISELEKAMCLKTNEQTIRRSGKFATWGDIACWVEYLLQSYKDWIAGRTQVTMRSAVWVLFKVWFVDEKVLEYAHRRANAIASLVKVELTPSNCLWNRSRYQYLQHVKVEKYQQLVDAEKNAAVQQRAKDQQQKPVPVDDVKDLIDDQQPDKNESDMEFTDVAVTAGKDDECNWSVINDDKEELLAADGQTKGGDDCEWNMLAH